MASYQIHTDHACRDCGKMTPYFPQCLACCFEKPLPLVEVAIPKSKLRRVKARRIHPKERDGG